MTLGMPPRIMAAPTGARRSKADHPRLPITTEEIAAEACACAAAGADEIHVHVRDDDGLHSIDPARYRETVAAVAEAAPGLAIQITTESGGRFSVAEQLSCLEDLSPPWATLAVREALRDRAIAAKIYALCAERNIRLQHILYDASDVDLIRDAYATDLLPETSREVIFVLGAYAPPRVGRPDEMAALSEAANALRLDWAACAFGPGEIACLTEAMRLGGHVRVGLENNIHHPDGALVEGTAAQVARMVEIRTSLQEHP